jgi:hypothetical protein
LLGGGAKIEAHNALCLSAVFKKLVYEMRFDEASARYGEFGAFWRDLQFPSD